MFGADALVDSTCEPSVLGGAYFGPSVAAPWAYLVTYTATT